MKVIVRAHCEKCPRSFLVLLEDPEVPIGTVLVQPHKSGAQQFAGKSCSGGGKRTARLKVEVTA